MFLPQIIKIVRSQFGLRRTFTVFNPHGRFVGGRPPTFHVHGERGFSSNSPSESDEFVRSKVARLQFVAPSRVDPNRSLVTWADAPCPVLILRDVAAGPTNEPGMQRRNLLLNIMANSICGVAWH